MGSWWILGGWDIRGMDNKKIKRDRSAAVDRLVEAVWAYVAEQSRGREPNDAEGNLRDLLAAVEAEKGRRDGKD